MIKTKQNFFQTSDGTHIYFEDHGSGPVILMIPGYLCTSKFFSKNIAALSAQNRLILMDSRGHGSSDKTLKNLTIDRCAQDVKELIDHLGLDDVFLIGWSLGSSIVMSYWQQFNRYKISKIGITDSALYPFSPEDWNSHSLKGYNMDGFAAVMNKAISDHEGYCRAFAQAIWKTSPTPENLAWVTEEFRKTPPWIAFALYSDFLHRDYASLLPTLTVPTIVFGADSPAIPQGEKMATYYMQKIQAPSELHLFKNGGHMLFYVENDKYNSTLISFMQKYPQ